MVIDWYHALVLHAYDNKGIDWCTMQTKWLGLSTLPVVLSLLAVRVWNGFQRSDIDKEEMKTPGIAETSFDFDYHRLALLCDVALCFVSIDVILLDIFVVLLNLCWLCRLILQALFSSVLLYFVFLFFVVFYFALLWVYFWCYSLPMVLCYVVTLQPAFGAALASWRRWKPFWGTYWEDCGGAVCQMIASTAFHLVELWKRTPASASGWIWWMSTGAQGAPERNFLKYVSRWPTWHTSPRRSLCGGSWAFKVQELARSDQRSPWWPSVNALSKI